MNQAPGDAAMDAIAARFDGARETPSHRAFAVALHHLANLVMDGPPAPASEAAVLRLEHAVIEAAPAAALLLPDFEVGVALGCALSLVALFRSSKAEVDRSNDTGAANDFYDGLVILMAEFEVAFRCEEIAKRKAEREARDGRATVDPFAEVWINAPPGSHLVH